MDKTVMANIDEQTTYTSVITINMIPWELKEFWAIKSILFKAGRTMSSKFSWPYSRLSNSPICYSMQAKLVTTKGTINPPFSIRFTKFRPKVK